MSKPSPTFFIIVDEKSVNYLFSNVNCCAFDQWIDRTSGLKQNLGKVLKYSLLPSHVDHETAFLPCISLL